MSGSNTVKKLTLTKVSETHHTDVASAIAELIKIDEKIDKKINEKTQEIEAKKTSATQKIDEDVQTVEAKKNTGIQKINEDVQTVEAIKNIGIQKTDEDIQAVEAKKTSATQKIDEDVQAVETKKTSATQKIDEDVQAVQEEKKQIEDLKKSIESANEEIKKIDSSKINKSLEQTEKNKTDIIEARREIEKNKTDIIYTKTERERLFSLVGQTNKRIDDKLKPLYLSLGGNFANDAELYNHMITYSSDHMGFANSNREDFTRFYKVVTIKIHFLQIDYNRYNHQDISSLRGEEGIIFNGLPYPIRSVLHCTPRELFTYRGNEKQFIIKNLWFTRNNKTYLSETSSDYYDINKSTRNTFTLRNFEFCYYTY